MNIDEAKKNLNKMVDYKGDKETYMLTACILRKNERGYFYRVELLDTKHGNSVLIVGLKDISAIEEGETA